MKVSIITVCFNSASTIKDTIESVLSQDHADLEYIIVDGGSTDDTLTIIASYGERITRCISEKDRGIYDGMNKGIQLATGELIGILNSDDVYQDPKVVSDVVKQIESSRADALYADLVYVDQRDLKKVKRFWKAGEYREGLFRKGWMPPHPTFFVKKKVYEQFGLFNLDLKSAADYEIMLRFIHKHKISLCYLPRVITRMRVGGKSNTTLMNRIRANREDKKAWTINGLKPGLFTLIRKPLSKLGQFMKKGDQN